MNYLTRVHKQPTKRSDCFHTVSASHKISEENEVSDIICQEIPVDFVLLHASVSPYSVAGVSTTPLWFFATW